MKLYQILNQLGRELSSEIYEIISDPKTKTDARKRTRILDAWHMRFNRAMNQAGDTYSMNIIKAYGKMIDCNILKMSLEDDLKMVLVICKKMQDVQEGDWL